MKALIIIDFQNDFVTGSLGFPEAPILDARIVKKIEREILQGTDIVFTFDTHDESYLSTQEGVNLPTVHCIKGTPGWNLYGETAHFLQKASAVFEKDSFGSLELANYLKERNYDEIELVGLVSHICVLTQAVLAKTALPEAVISVDASCTASYDSKLHEAALNIMQALQIKVTERIS